MIVYSNVSVEIKHKDLLCEINKGFFKNKKYITPCTDQAC